METANAPNAAPLSLLEELSNITNSAANLAEQSADTGKAAIKLRRKSKDLCEVLEEIHDEVESLAEAASVFRSLGGFKKVRRNSKHRRCLPRSLWKNITSRPPCTMFVGAKRKRCR